MGTLTDITTKANNAAKRPSNTSLTSTPNALDLTKRDENQSKGKSPRFMSPTLSSTQQTVNKPFKSTDRDSTPPSSTSNKTQRSNWVASAAKRVGFRRVSNRTPRTSKADTTIKAIAFPDKLATSSYVMIPDAPVSSPSQSLPMSLSEKPLPSPPFAQITKASPVKGSRALIDASEKPLRRSPPGLPYKQEEWPVLSPQKVSTTHTSQTTSQHAKLPPSSILNERYHEFGSASPSADPTGSKSGAKSSPSQNIRRKQVPPTKSRDQLDRMSKPVPTVKTVPQLHGDKHGDVITVSGLVESSSSTASPDLSPSAISLEKSAATLTQPRQTRTSSLRARLAAGQLTKENPIGKTRVAGFTDFTSVKDTSGKSSKGRLSVPEGTRTRSHGHSVTNLLRAKSSEGSIRTNYAPAQFVGGSRRPNIHRPSSRNSLPSDSRATGPSPTVQPPKRPAPSVPVSNGVMEPAQIVAAESSKTSEHRRSSIPVFRHSISNVISQAENGAISNNTKKDDSGVSDTLRNAFDIFEDQVTERLPLDYNEDATEKSPQHQHELTASNSMPYSASLQAIEESPRQGYHIKRLSIASPEMGPTLKISPDAERLIMGVETDQNGLKFKNPNLRHNPSGTESTADLKKRLDRPSSSQGLSQSASRFGLVSKESREKKVRSAEFNYSLPTDHLHQQSTAKPKTPLVRKSEDVFAADDPFFEAQSTLEQDQTEMANSTVPNNNPTGDEEKVMNEEASWISPLVNKDHDLSSGKTVLAGDSPPTMLQNSLSSGSSANHIHSIVAAQAKEPAEVEQIPSEGTPKNKDHPEKPLPSTPGRFRQFRTMNSCNFPPRSSSRTTPPDYTLRGSAKPSPTSPIEAEDLASKEFLRRHNQLGASKGHASSQVDIYAVSKRDSTARDSAKSQSSLSKGMLSNIRGLFHKRSLDNEPCSIRASKKHKPFSSIGPSGSPFLPVSEVHPIHRPTLASSSRCLVKGPKPNELITNVNTPATPSFMSPMPSEISATTTLAMQLLESVRTERSSPKKERALELGTIMVEAITQARDAEKAMEEAKQAARKAEVACALCNKAVGDVSRRVLEWRDEFCA